MSTLGDPLPPPLSTFVNFWRPPPPAPWVDVNKVRSLSTKYIVLKKKRKKLRKTSICIKYFFIKTPRKCQKHEQIKCIWNKHKFDSK